MDSDLTEIKVHLAEIKTDLRHHIKRTELLENEVRSWRSDLEPIKRHVITIQGLGKILVIVSAVGTTIAGFIAIF